MGPGVVAQSAALGEAAERGVAIVGAGQIGFAQIPELIGEALNKIPNRTLDDIEGCVEIDDRTRALVGSWVHAAPLMDAAAR